MSNRVDQVAMLLSTDWFANKWYVFGIESNSSSCQKLKMECRVIVDELFSEEKEYWLVSFDDDRIEKTRKMFFSAVSHSSMDKQDVDRLTRIVEKSESEMKEASLLENLTALLSSNPDDEILGKLPRSLAEKVTVICSEGQRPVDLQSALHSSTSQWDLEIAKRTPGLPEYLADFADGVRREVGFFQQSWARLMTQLSSEERDKVLSWYRQMALELAGVQISFG